MNPEDKLKYKEQMRKIKYENKRQGLKWNKTEMRTGQEITAKILNLKAENIQKAEDCGGNIEKEPSQMNNLGNSLQSLLGQIGKRK